MTTSRRRIDDATAALLTQNTEPWMSCDECFELTDRCVEDLLERHRAPGEALSVHLAACPACFEDVSSLLALVAAERGMDATESAALLRDSMEA